MVLNNSTIEKADTTLYKSANRFSGTDDGCEEFGISAQPSAYLAPVVESFWYRTSSGERMGQPSRLVLPRAAITIAFQIKGHKRCGPFVVSSIARSAVVPREGEGEQTSFGINLTAIGARLLLPFQIQELEKYYYYDMSDVFPEWEVLFARLSDAPSFSARISLVEEAITNRICWDRPNRAIVGEFVRAVVRRRGSIRVSLVADECGLSPRQLQRLTLDTLGVTPQKYGRIVRFLYACAHLQSGQLDMVSLACALEYADQSHFIRDFKLFSGRTPSQFVQNKTTTYFGHETRMYPTSPCENPVRLQ